MRSAAPDGGPAPRRSGPRSTRTCTRATGYRTTSIAPARGAYDPALGEFILPERDLADVDDSDAAVIAFFEATYGAGATQAGWDRAALEVKRETGR